MRSDVDNVTLLQGATYGVGRRAWTEHEPGRAGPQIGHTTYFSLSVR
jgi:hypothetical protein